MRKKLFKTLVAAVAAAGMLSMSMGVFAAETYTVQEGDNLRKIAKNVMGDAAKWETIYEANKGSIKNPNIIYRGQVFIIPNLSAADTGTDTTIDITTDVTTETTADTTTADKSEKRLVRAIEYDSDGSIGFVYDYSYDSQGNQIRVTESISGMIWQWTDYSYDNQGNLIMEADGYPSLGEEVSFSAAGAKQYKTYSYDSQGNRIKETLFSDDMIEYEFDYEYDAQGNLMKRTSSYVSWWYEYSYDSQGNLIKEVEYELMDNGISNTMEWTDYSYDSQGNRIAEAEYFGDGELYKRFDYSYDSQGNRIKKTVYSGDGMLDGWFEYIYE